LLTKIKAVPYIRKSPGQENGWYAKVFRHRRKQYIAALESKTLVTVIFPGSGIISIENFEKALRQSILNLFNRRGWEMLLDQEVSYDSAGIIIEKALDRRLMGCLNEMTRLAHYEIEDFESIDTVIDRINEAPMSVTQSASEWLLDEMIGRKSQNLEGQE
jgi:hypothetical protein